MLPLPVPERGSETKTGRPTRPGCDMPDVVVVGGGVVGVACAYYLARAGRAVTLLDRGPVGGACSHGNCGYVCPSHVLPLAVPGALLSTLKTLTHKNGPLRLTPRAVLGNAGWFARFARRCNPRDMLRAAAALRALLDPSRRLYETLLADEGIDCEWDARGLLFLFHTPRAFRHYAAVDRLVSSRFGQHAERFDAAEVLALEPALKPGAAAGGYLYRGDAQLRPDRLMRGWRHALERLGVTVREGVELLGFAPAGDGKAAVARTSHGDVPAGSFVVATGAWTPQLNRELGASVPIVPGKGYSVTMPRPAVCPSYPMIFEEHRVAVSPFRSGLRVGSTMEFAGYDDRVHPARLDLLTRGAAFYLRDPGGAAEEAWAGWRPMVFDGLPVIDFAPRYKNVLVAAGHGMLGLSMAPATGQLAAALVTGTAPSVDPAPYSLRRFR